MKMKDLSPKAEPAIWGLLVASALAALGSYGLNITDELKDFLIMVAPYVLGFIAVRFAVFAPDTVEDIRDGAYEAGTPPTEPKPEVEALTGDDDLRGWHHYDGGRSSG